jgi:argininosuccinate lyase
MVIEDIDGSIAHVAMLGKQGIIPQASADRIADALAALRSEAVDGTLVVDESFEDVHSFLEFRLTERLGDEGRMVHAGRSRNDQVAVDTRLYLKKRVTTLITATENTVETLLDVAEAHLETLMPGYTHLQRAQPVTLAHHLCAWAVALKRDAGRFVDALARLDECPLGAGALATSSLPLDRQAVSDALGFARPTLNSMDSIADRDYAVEVAAAAAITQTHLSRFCEDIVLWASEEFKFVNLADAWSTGSSIMPQKKNPDFAELIRGKSGRVTGNLVALLTMMKGLSYSYGKDLQEDKEALFDSLDTVEECLVVFSEMIQSAHWNAERMAAACGGGFLEATDAAEYLVQKGVPFRRAHEIAASLVRLCITAGRRSLRDLPIDDFTAASPLFSDDIYERLSPAACVCARGLPGGPAPEAVRRAIAELRRTAG